MVGLALRLPAGGFNDVHGRRGSPGPPGPGSVGPAGLDDRDRRCRAGIAGLVQVRRVVERQRRQRRPPSRDGRSHPVVASHAPGRDLVLHVHGPVVRDRHLQGQSRALTVAGRGRVRCLLPAPGRGTDRARLGLASPDPQGSPTRPAPHRPSQGRVPDIWRPVQEGRALELRLVPDRGPGVREPSHALFARGPLGHLRLCGADLLRLQWLYRHRHRLRAPARLPFPG